MKLKTLRSAGALVVALVALGLPAEAGQRENRGHERSGRASQGQAQRRDGAPTGPARVAGQPSAVQSGGSEPARSEQQPRSRVPSQPRASASPQPQAPVAPQRQAMVARQRQSLVAPQPSATVAPRRGVRPGATTQALGAAPAYGSRQQAAPAYGSGQGAPAYGNRQYAVPRPPVPGHPASGRYGPPVRYDAYRYDGYRYGGSRYYGYRSGAYRYYGPPRVLYGVPPPSHYYGSGGHFSVYFAFGSGYLYGAPYAGRVYGYSAPVYGGYSAPAYSAPAYYGDVRLQVLPRDATVYVDGYYAGIAADFDGAFQRLTLEVGPHQIELAAPGLEPRVFEVYVDPARSVTIHTDLFR